MINENDNLNHPVCVFDSGIGGLTLFAECVKKYPDVDFAYFADNYNVPYGNLPPDRIYELTLSVFEKIARLNPRAAIIACNTATAVCAQMLREKYAFPILGIQPAIKPAAINGDKILVLATRATVKSRTFGSLIARYGTDKTRVIDCPDLAEYIERNIDSYPEIDVSRFLPEASPDAVVLGCTHYSFVKKSIKNRYECPTYDGISGTVDHLKPFLGIGDHIVVNNRNIAFLCGDFDKNKAVFEKLIATNDN